MKTARLKEWTYEEFMALPIGEPVRYEIIDGELCMTPSPVPRHQEISWNLTVVIGSFLKTRPIIGRSFSAPIDVVFSKDPPQVVVPDLVFVSMEHLSLITDKNLQGVPDLLVEILSPTTSLRDRREKHSLYERFGVPEYWIVNPDRNTVQVFRLSGGRYAEAREFGLGDRLDTPLLPGLSILLSEVFPA